MKVKTKDIIIMGFALFAMFFGAGNVIFPPFLGMQSSPDWFPSICGFLIADVFISCFAIIVMAKNDDGIDCITRRIGKIPSKILNITIILCMGPLIALPRTAAASFDVLMVPVFNVNPGTWTQVIFSLCFYTLTWILVIKPTRICDIVGKILTPLLLLTIVMFTISNIIEPIGPQAITPLSDEPLADGLLAGYQSMDLFGALCFGGLMIETAKAKKYKTKKSRIKLLSMASIICLGLLCFTSISMCYLGSTCSYEFSAITSQATLLAKIGSYLFDFGAPLIGLLACLACLTTAIGISSGTSLFFKRYITKPQKLKTHAYEVVVTITCCIAFILSNMGFEKIIEYAAPVLLVIFPMVVVLVILSWFNKKIKSDLVFKFAAFTALVVNLILVICQNCNIELSTYIPLYDFNLGWLIPTAISIPIGFLFANLFKHTAKSKNALKSKNSKGQKISKTTR